MWQALSQLLRRHQSFLIEISAMSSDAIRGIIRDLPYFVSASRSQVIGAEDDVTMTQYEMPMEEQIKLLVKKFDSLDKKFDAMEEKFDAMEQKFDKKFNAIDKKFDDKFTQIMVRLDDTHAVAKLGLEGLQGLRESMDEKFEAAAKTSAGQTDMLKAVLVHVRKRVEVLERPKPRRRRS